MIKIKQKGFVFAVVVMLMALIGAEMFVLTNGCNTILFQTNTAYLKACERNLKASGFAFSRMNLKAANKSLLSKALKMDVSDMGIKKSSLSITINASSPNTGEVQIETVVSRGGQRHRKSEKYIVQFNSE